MTEDEIIEIKSDYQKRMASCAKSHTSKFSIVDLFRYRSLLSITLLGNLVHFIIITGFYGPALIVEQFNFNIFLNGLVIGTSEFTAYPLCLFLITRLGRKKIAYGCFIISFISAGALTFLWKQGNHEANFDVQNILVLVFVFIFRYAMTV